MIHLYSGDTGAGKSYNAIAHALIPAMKAGRIVVTNIPLRNEEGEQCQEGDIPLIQQDYPKGEIIYFDKMEPLTRDARGNESFNQSFFTDYDRFPRGCVYLLDEVWRYWPAGLRASDVSVDNNSFFTEHRHRAGADGRTSEIVLITQDHTQIATFARNLINKTFHITKADIFGKLGERAYHVDIHQKHPGINRKPFAGDNGTYKESVYKYYISNTDSEEGGVSDIQEKTLDKRTNVLGKKLRTMAFTFVLVCLALWWIFELFNPEQAMQDAGLSMDGYAPVSGEPQQQESAPKQSDFILPNGSQVVITGSYIDDALYHFFTTDTGQTFSTKQLRLMGYRVSPLNQCLVDLVDMEDNRKTVRCGQIVKEES